MAAKAPVTRGRRVALPAVAARDAEKAIYVCTSRPLPFGDLTLSEGVEVPGASSWTRLDAWVGARRIRKIDPAERYISFDKFVADQVSTTSE